MFSLGSRPTGSRPRHGRVFRDREVTMIRRSLLVLAMVAAVGTGGCASTSGGGSTVRMDPNLITAEELAELRVSNLYDAIQRLRPRWLTVRAQQSLSTPTSVVVYQNQTQLGGFTALRELGLDAVTSIRYLDGPTASASLPGIGTRQVEGAIVIYTTERN